MLTGYTDMALLRARGIRIAIEAQRGERVTQIHLGRPVNFEGRHPGRNAVAVARLGEAAGYAGLHGAHFYPEPVAATLSGRRRIA